MNIAIIGAGSLGMLLAYRIKASGMNPLLITHSRKQKDQLIENGLRLDSSSDQAVYLSCLSMEEWTQHSERADWVFCTVKQQHIKPLLSAAAHRIAALDANWLFFQNGIGHLETAAHVMQAERIFAAVTTEGARKLNAYTVAHTGKGVTRIGCQDLTCADANNPVFRSMQNLCNVLKLAGFRAEVSKNINQRIWEKLLVNAVINPVTGIAGVTNGQLLQEPRLLKLMSKLFSEGQAVADAMQVALPENLWQHVLDVCAQTASNRSSMLQDLDHQRTTEIQWINGSIVKQAAICGIPVPTHEAVSHLISCMH